VDDGYLAGVEIVDHAEPHGKLSRVFPSPSEFDPPLVRGESS